MCSITQEGKKHADNVTVRYKYAAEAAVHCSGAHELVDTCEQVECLWVRKNTGREQVMARAGGMHSGLCSNLI